MEISSEEYGLNKDSVALFEHVKTIDKMRLKEKIGEVPKSLFNEIDNALSITFDIRHAISAPYTQQLKEYVNELIKPLVITEGKTDVQLIKTAWLKLYPNKDMPFECNA